MTGCPLLDSEYAARQNGKRLPCERLAEENAKLREQLEYEHQTSRSRLESVDMLKAENAKLRELVRDMWGFIEGTDEDCGDVTFSSCFDYCKHNTADDGCSKIGECWYEQRVREFGGEL